MNFFTSAVKISTKIFSKHEREIRHTYLPTVCTYLRKLVYIIYSTDIFLLFVFLFVKCTISDFYYPWDEKCKESNLNFFVRISCSIWLIYSIKLFKYCLIFVEHLKNSLATSLSCSQAAAEKSLSFTYMTYLFQGLGLISFEVNFTSYRNHLFELHNKWFDWIFYVDETDCKCLN